tara:strand:+ start:137 stop:1900 length:1764 start_codon:yes stop_codon:yes gene_type:complete
MEQSTIIKLRQQEATSIETNGSFSSTLGERILLEQGDVVKLHSAYIDTTTESVIVLNDDVPVSMSCVKWFTNARANEPFINTNDPVGIVSPDTKKYFVCRNRANNDNGYLVKSVLIVPENHGPGRYYGDANIPYRYRDPADYNTWIDGYQYLKGQSTTKNPRGVEVPLNIIINGGGADADKNIIFNPDNASLGHNVSSSASGKFTFGGNVPSTKIATPYEKTLTFIISAGIYTPAEIAQIITDECSKLDSTGAVGDNYSGAGGLYCVNSPFLQTLAQVNDDITNTTGGAQTLCFVPEFIESVSTASVPNILLPTTPNPASLAADILIGCNNFSLNYDDNLKKLNFDILHTPWNSALETVWTPGIIYSNDQPIRSYSGVAFTSLQPTNFWHSLGFQNAEIKIDYPEPAITLTDNTKILLPGIYPVLGTNTTEQYVGLDSIWNKVAPTTEFYTPFLGATVTDLTTPIISSRTFDDVVNDEGYYYLSIGMKFPQKMIGGVGTGGSNNSSNSIQAIVGKYYTSGNFLQVGSDSAIMYEHQGEPQLLSDLNVRLLHADQTPPSQNELGPKNSIFLELIKSSSFPNAPAPASK